MRASSWIFIAAVALLPLSRADAQQLTIPLSTASPDTPVVFPEQQYRFGPYITAGQYKDWLISVDLTLRSFSDNLSLDGIDRVRYEVWVFDSIRLDWPLFRRGASHIMALDEVELDIARKGFRPDSKPTVLIGPEQSVSDLKPVRAADYAPPTLFQSAGYVARYEHGEVEERELQAYVSIPVRAWETVYHEAEANRVAWPDGPWPHEAQATFVPQAYIDVTPQGDPVDLSPIRQLLDRWLDGNQPRDTTPAQLAKYLAGRVQTHVKTNEQTYVTVGDSRAGITTGFVAGLRVGMPTLTAQNGRGNGWDLVNLLCAVYRMAGIPARTVYAARATKDDRELIEQDDLDPVHAWVEWCLYDEPNGTVNWIPVDIIALRESSSQSYPLNQPWEYFGTHRYLDEYPPFALHVQPPTPTATYAAPGFYGWAPTPKAPQSVFANIEMRVWQHPRDSSGSPLDRAFSRERW